MSCLIILPFLVNPVLAQNWFFCEKIRVFFMNHKGTEDTKERQEREKVNFRGFL
jgi:hypothetical protein